MVRKQFERTVCDCEKRSKHCLEVPGMLAVDDVPLIEKHGTGNFRASLGAVVLLRGEMKRIMTIVPAMADDACVFLQPDGLCRIHEESPFGCSLVDSRISRPEGHERVALAFMEIVRDFKAHGECRVTWEGLARGGVIENRTTMERRLWGEHEQSKTSGDSS